MKTNRCTSLLLSITVVLYLIISCSQSEKDMNWQLVWEDDFNNRNLNEAFWSKIPRGKPDWKHYMSDFDSCYAIQNGNLVLRGIINHSLPNDTATYLTGGVYTKDKVGFSNGRIDIRARLHGAQGAWPAFWLLPETGHWPHAGEIDIMERLNYDSIAYQTVHSNYTVNLGIKNHPQHGSIGKIDPDNYNIYSVEMYQDSLSFFINNKHTFTYPRIKTDKEGQFPFDKNEFYLLLDMQLEGNWVGKADSSQLPVQLEIDWVRFYKKEKK